VALESHRLVFDLQYSKTGKWRGDQFVSTEDKMIKTAYFSTAVISILSILQTASAQTNLKFNFQPPSTAVPSGYIADTGIAYGLKANGQTYGWNTTVYAYARDRDTHPDQRFDTLIYMQKNGNSFSWELSLLNGSYLVRIVAGDDVWIDGVYRINVEGQLFLSGTATTTQKFFDVTRTVTVSDGKLSVTNGSGGIYNRINFIEVSAVTAPSPTPTATPTPTPMPTATGQTLRVMAWNVKHGNAGLSTITQEIKASGAQVVLLNEVRYYNQAEYETRMETLTGKSWYSSYALSNGSDGNLLLSSLPFQATESGRWTAPTATGCYPTRSAVRAAILYNGVTINFFAFHNDVCEGNRNYLIQRFLEFAQPTSGGPQIIGGDFNVTDNYPSIREMSYPYSPYYGQYHDSWTYVTGQTGTSSASKTHTTWRIDYHFFSRAHTSRVRAKNIWLRNFDYSLSDHRSVMADYLVVP
jgi:endonuclease/exonuclease/phosphatase (EEP) superfamily protein YafD